MEKLTKYELHTLRLALKLSTHALAHQLGHAIADKNKNGIKQIKDAINKNKLLTAKICAYIQN